MTQLKASHWNGERIARLGFLIGLGCDAKRIADDPIIASTKSNVHRQAQRFGRVLDEAACRRGMTRDGLVRLLVATVADDQTLLDNVLDDEVAA